MAINQLKAGVILSYISIGLGTLVQIICIPLMLRLLGQSEYGLYNLSVSIISYLSLFSFGFGGAYIRYYSRYKIRDDHDNVAALNGMYLIIFILIGVVAAVAGIILVLNLEAILGNKFSPSDMATAKRLMSIMVFSITFSFLFTVFNSFITANERFIFQNVLQIIKQIMSPVLSILLLLMGYGSVGMVIITTIISASIDISNAVLCFTKLKMKFKFRNFNFPLIKEMAIFSSYLFMNMVIDQINWNVDKFIVGRYRGTVSVAVYGVAAQLNIFYMSLSTAVSYVFIPKINKMVFKDNDNKELTHLFTRVGRIQFIFLALICSGFVFFGQVFINLWAGADYSDSYYVALLLIIPVTIPLIQNLGIEIQKAKNMHKFRSWTYLLIAFINIISSIILTKSYGAVGAAAGTMIAILIGNVIIMNWYYQKKVALDMKYFWTQILKLLPAFIPPVIVGTLLYLFVGFNRPVLFLLCGGIYFVIFCISMWFFGMNAYEKNLVKKPVMTILKRRSVQ